MGCSSTAGGPGGEHVEGELACANGLSGRVCECERVCKVCVCVCVHMCESCMKHPLP